MKFTVSMKDPDTLHDTIKEEVARDVAKMGLTDLEEIEALTEVRFAKVNGLCQKWFEYGEYLRVEVDTEAGTCTVLPCGR